MPSVMRSLRQEQRALSNALRGQHKTWIEIASVFRERYHVNLRAGLRMVRNWSQRDAADQWNQRWPADPKTFKNFSYWELWPATTGHAPSLDTLARLAELYECSIADLLADCADFRARDTAYQDGRQLASIPSLVTGDTIESSAVPELLARLESADAHEIARLIASWADRIGTGMNRRSLLLKLSAGLSLAATSPTFDDVPKASSNTPLSLDNDFTGIWHSTYVYPSTGRKDDFVGEHYVVVRQSGNLLNGQSLAHSTGSHLKLELTVDGQVATGAWRETTSPTGYYRGATYHGTLHLVIEPSGRRMRGMWLGFGRDFVVNSGQWELDLRDSSTGKNARRAYELKA
jgi:hypothetical protein